MEVSPLTDFKISHVSTMAKKTHELLEKIKSSFANISYATIREYYSKDGETMLELDLNYFKDIIPYILKSISELQNDELTTEQKEKLDESEKLAKDSSKILEDTQNIIENIMKYRLNNAIMGPTLQDLARETIFKNPNIKDKVKPKSMEFAVLHQRYPGSPGSDDDDDKQYHVDGGFRNRKNKTKNKKYTKKTTYKRPKNVYPRKNKTRKMKKNYL